jgi:hypothetical protein
MSIDDIRVGTVLANEIGIVFAGRDFVTFE